MPDTAELAGANPRAPYYPALNGIRAVAVLAVFYQHYVGSIAGLFGVQAFFVLSGFLITGLLFDARDTPHRFRNFYVRRTLRIVPLYYGLWLALFLLTPVLHIVWTRSNLAWPLYLGNFLSIWSAHTHNPNALHLTLVPSARWGDHLFTGHLWSLCVEEQFYLFWPTVVFGLRDRKRLVRVCVCVILASPLLRMLAMHLLPPAYGATVGNITPLCLDQFLMGALGALLLRGPGAGTLKRYAPLLFLGATGSMVAIVCTLRSLYPASLSPLLDPHWLFCYGFPLADLASLGLIVWCLSPSALPARLLQWSPLQQLGLISYGFYVFHDIFHRFLMHLAARLRLTGSWSLLVPFLGTLALATASYHLYEKRFLRFKVRFEA